VQSAFQKSIRRGLEEDALFWGTELHLHGGVNQAWNRMQIIASEDVGLASPSAPILIRTLHDAWRDLTAKDKIAMAGCTSSMQFCFLFERQSRASLTTQLS
jgi:replication-associated recombination protein RarA